MRLSGTIGRVAEIVSFGEADTMLSRAAVEVLSAGATAVADKPVTESSPMKRVIIRELIGMECFYLDYTPTGLPIDILFLKKNKISWSKDSKRQAPGQMKTQFSHGRR